MASNLNHKVLISGPDVNFEKSVTPEIAEKIMILAITNKFNENPAEPNDSSENDLPTSMVSGTKTIKTSIREFLDNHNVKRSPDKITATAYYLKYHNKLDYFNREDIITTLEDAAEKPFGNFPRDLKWTLKTGWIAIKKGEKSIYYLTNTGKAAVDSNFSKEFLEKSKIHITAPKKSSKKKEN